MNDEHIDAIQRTYDAAREYISHSAETSVPDAWPKLGAGVALYDSVVELEKFYGGQLPGDGKVVWAPLYMESQIDSNWPSNKEHWKEVAKYATEFEAWLEIQLKDVGGIDCSLEHKDAFKMLDIKRGMTLREESRIMERIRDKAGSLLKWKKFGNAFKYEPTSWVALVGAIRAAGGVAKWNPEPDEIKAEKEQIRARNLAATRD